MYAIIFENNEVWCGGNVENSKWNEMPNLPIQSLFYTINGEKIKFENYESYNHIVERTYNITLNTEIVNKVIIMALKNNIIITYTFDLIRKMGYLGSEKKGKEYNGGPTIGWKLGIEKQESFFKLL